MPQEILPFNDAMEARSFVSKKDAIVVGPSLTERVKVVCRFRYEIRVELEYYAACRLAADCNIEISQRSRHEIDLARKTQKAKVRVAVEQLKCSLA